MEKGITKATVIKVAVVAVIVVALVVTAVFSLKGCQTDPTVPGGATTQPSQTQPNDPAVTTFTVTFKDYDGTVLKTETVDSGKAATAPDDPVREHFTFTGWDKSFDNVTADLVVTATYKTDKKVIYVESVTVKKGTKTVTMNIRVANNPGIMGAVLKVSVDDKAFTFEDGKKTAYPALTLTTPGADVKASPYTFMLDALELSAADKQDGTLFTVTFNVKDTAAVGKYDVKLSCDKNAVFDENYKDPKVVLGNGTITIE